MQVSKKHPTCPTRAGSVLTVVTSSNIMDSRNRRSSPVNKRDVSDRIVYFCKHPPIFVPDVPIFSRIWTGGQRFSMANNDNMIFRDDIKPQDVIEEQVFVVERLLGRRSMMRKGKRIERETQYLVKWDGYGIHECSWCVRSTSFFFPTVSNPHHLKNISWIGPLNKWYQGIPCQPETSRYQISEKL